MRGDNGMIFGLPPQKKQAKNEGIRKSYLKSLRMNKIIGK